MSWLIGLDMKYDMKYTLYDMKCGILRQNLMTTIKRYWNRYFGFVALLFWVVGKKELHH